MKDGLMLIGELAAFFGVSRKALRLYEKKGIIKPAKTDDRNGYRYYAPEQVRQLNALLELKALGFSLDEIKGIVDGEASKGLPHLHCVLWQLIRLWPQSTHSVSKISYCMPHFTPSLPIAY